MVFRPVIAYEIQLAPLLAHLVCVCCDQIAVISRFLSRCLPQMRWYTKRFNCVRAVCVLHTWNRLAAQQEQSKRR